MTMTLTEIAALEIREDYPAAIDELEAYLRENPGDVEAVVRLGFNLWYAVEGNDRMQKPIPVAEYAQRFMGLLAEYKGRLSQNADFCWAFGLGISMFWHFFPGTTEEQGKGLLRKAVEQDQFYARMNRGAATQEEISHRFAGRGRLAGYYAVE